MAWLFENIPQIRQRAGDRGPPEQDAVRPEDQGRCRGGGQGSRARPGPRGAFVALRLFEQWRNRECDQTAGGPPEDAQIVSRRPDREEHPGPSPADLMDGRIQRLDDERARQGRRRHHCASPSPWTRVRQAARQLRGVPHVQGPRPGRAQEQRGNLGQAMAVRPTPRVQHHIARILGFRWQPSFPRPQRAANSPERPLARRQAQRDAAPPPRVSPSTAARGPISRSC